MTVERRTAGEGSGGSPRPEIDESEMSSVYDELRAVAAAYLRRERPEHTLQPTALVNEAYLKLAQAEAGSAVDLRAFRAVAANLMREILVDHARGRAAAKRGGQRVRVAMNEVAVEDRAAPFIDLLGLDEALSKLAALDERKARVVELRFFGGLTNAEVANRLGLSPKTTEADWYMARAWLRSALADCESPCTGRDQDVE